MASSVAQSDLKRDRLYLLLIGLLVLGAFTTVFKPLRKLPPEGQFTDVYYVYRYEKTIGPGQTTKDSVEADLRTAFAKEGIPADTRVSFPSTTELKLRVPCQDEAEAKTFGEKLDKIVPQTLGERFGKQQATVKDDSGFPDRPLARFAGFGLYRPRLHVRLGLDLKGGVHLVLKAQTQNVQFEYRLAETAAELIAALDAAGVPTASPAEQPVETPTSEPAEQPAEQPETERQGGTAEAEGEPAEPVALEEKDVSPEEASKLADEGLRRRVEDELQVILTALKSEAGGRLGDVHGEVISSNIVILRTYVELNQPATDQTIADHQRLLTAAVSKVFPQAKQLGEPDKLDVDPARAMDDVVRIVGERIDRLGVAEANVRKQGADRVVVELPGVKDPDEAIALLGTTARMEFRKVPERYSVDSQMVGGRNQVTFTLKDSNKVVPHELVYYEAPEFGTDKNILLGKDLERGSVTVQYDNEQRPAIAMNLTRAASARFDAFANENQNKFIATYLDRKCIDARVIKERHYGGSILLTGGFATISDATNLKILLDAGALPVPVDVVEQRTVSATLGADSVRQSSRAALLGLALILVFMAAFYKLPGVLADVALFGYLMLLLAALVMFEATLTLPGILGIVLSIGMAVDANVIIFERLKEELRESTTRPLQACIRNSYDRAFSAILDGNVTTLIIGFILFYMGTGPIKGFAVTLSIGILCSMFTALIVTRVLQRLTAATTFGGDRRVYRH